MNKKVLSLFSLCLLSVFLTSCNKETYTKTQYTDGLQFELNEKKDGYILTENLSNEEDIIIPELYKGKPVREIADEVFIYSEIKSVELPKSLRKIGKKAFFNASGLTKLEIPNGVTTIENEAFFLNTSLKEIDIPSSVSYIGENAFSHETSLVKFVVDEKNKTYTSLNNVLYNKDYSTLINYPLGSKNTTYDINKATKTISSYAFYGCSNLTSITIPNSVETIEYRGLAALSSLTTITIDLDESNLKTIGEYAFSENSSLTSFKLPNKVEALGEYAFYKDRSLTSFSFNNNENIKEIPSGLFHSCAGLTTLILPSNLTSIGDKAFYSCSQLKKLSIPTTVTNIGSYAFYGNHSITSIEIPESIKTIKEGCFSSCISLSKFNFHKNLEVIEDKAFLGCSAFTSLNLSNTKINSIGASAFYGLTSITTIEFPTTLKNIGEKGFDGGTIAKIKNLELPEGLETIGAYAFNNYQVLNSVYIPKTIKTMGDYIFLSAGFDQKLRFKIYTPLSEMPTGVSKNWVRPEILERVQFNTTLEQYHTLIG